MFEDSLIESTRHIEKRRGWTTLVSTSAQVLLLALLIILPLLRPNAISAKLLSTSVMPRYISPGDVIGRRPTTGVTDSGRKPLMVVQMVQPHIIPRLISTGSDSVGPPPDPTRLPCSSNCGNNNTGPTDPFGFGHDSFPQVSLAKPPKPPIISHLDPGQIIRRVDPVYPSIARTARIQGTVILHAFISREGAIERLQVVSGHPLLDPAAIDAVRQWQFRPYVLNGQPIEIETEITVNFTLER